MINSGIKTDIILSKLTTIGLGGKAKYFIECNSTDEIRESLKFADVKRIPVQVLSGGSNIIFSDSGYEGLVLKISLKGIEFYEKDNFVFAEVKAGEVWDDLVKHCIKLELAGFECLSGIPGFVGATPIQNVGAYGQEVSESIVSLKAIERSTLKEVVFENKDCDFGYRQSRFKGKDKDKFIISEVRFRFERNKAPVIKYPELQRTIESNDKLSTVKNLREILNLIRNSVLELRRRKSMIIDINDPNSRSCGSFFMNPVLNDKEYNNFISKTAEKVKDVPVFKSGENNKISAAWLIEQAGFHKGLVRGGVGISEKHSLALINKNGTTAELLDLAIEIKEAVSSKFGIDLRIEPELIKTK